MKFKDLSKNTVASLLFSGMMLLIVLFNNGIPSYDDLEEISGTIEWFEAKGKNRDTLRFKLKEYNKTFVYHSVAGSIGAVTSVLYKKDVEIQILYDPNDSDSALWEFQTIHPVYQVVSDNKMIKSYRSAASKYNSNDELGIWLLIGGLFVSVICFTIDWSVHKDAN